MSVVSIRGRLNRAISRLPEAKVRLTKAEIDAKLNAIGIDPAELMQWHTDNPNATEIESVIAFSDKIKAHGWPGRKWTEAQALNFLEWRKKVRQKRLYRTQEGGVIRQ